MHVTLLENLPVTESQLRFIATIISMVTVLVVYILYTRNLQLLLKAVREPNRRLKPSMVWLVALGNALNILVTIPYLPGLTLPASIITIAGIGIYVVAGLNLLWNFFMINKISESLAAELTSRNIEQPSKPAYGLGMFMCGCNTLALAAKAPLLTELALMAGVAGFVAWIMYWVKTYQFRKRLTTLPPQKPFDF